MQEAERKDPKVMKQVVRAETSLFQLDYYRWYHLNCCINITDRQIIYLEVLIIFRKQVILSAAQKTDPSLRNFQLCLLRCLDKKCHLPFVVMQHTATYLL